MSDWLLEHVPHEEVTAAWLYEICRGHRLVPDNPEVAVASYRSLASEADVYKLMADEDEIGTVIISGKVEGETAVLDFIPVSRHFRSNYTVRLRRALTPLWVDLFEHDKIRRLTALAPVSRTRTIRALKKCGFVSEGVMREGTMLKDKEPEDVAILGLLALEYLTEE
jgi:hypothetical protein